MNLVLWIVAGLMAVAFAVGGLSKLLIPKADPSRRTMGGIRWSAAGSGPFSAWGGHPTDVPER